MLIILMMGFASGLPLALIGGTLQAWMKSVGVSLGTISLFAIVGLPYTLKFFWAPFMDRFSLFTSKKIGRRKSWMFVTQAALAEICGLTTVHVNRVMRQLREEGLCSFRASLVEIPDPVALAARGEFDPAYLYMETIPDFLSNVKRSRS